MIETKKGMKGDNRMKPEKVIEFPACNPAVSGVPTNRVRSGDGVKYYTESQIKLLRRTVKNQADLDILRGKVTAVRDWLAIDLITLTGVRVAEAANIRCGDIRVGYGQSELFIRYGKGAKSRTIQIPDSLKTHLKWFLRWKAEIGEAAGHDDFVFIGKRGPWTSQAVQQNVKKYLKRLGLYELGKSVHALRHSYAVQLYRKQRDLRAVQKQLGHSSIQTTQIYADVTVEDIQQQIKGFWS
jgi:integrase/recombinase XerD